MRENKIFNEQSCGVVLCQKLRAEPPSPFMAFKGKIATCIAPDNMPDKRPSFHRSKSALML